MFSNLRRHQRRISGRKSTAELRDFGQYQVLFLAESEEMLLAQIREVPVAEYNTQRRRLAMGEAPHQRCQAHFLSNLSEAVLPLDTKLRQQLKADLDGMPKVPEFSESPQGPGSEQQQDSRPFFQESPICHET
ncbi:hypothetical protein N0Y54_21450 [Nostoc punctiforme UO1]|uniref:hypothetical protein n=1 Tax=Nostoc punctiforme TaxID=272131 RepID=UPI003095B9CA